MKVYIDPFYRGEDKGDGGIRRVVEAQHRWLPEFGIEPVDSQDRADLIATHATSTVDVPVDKPWVTHCHGLYWAEYEWMKWAHNMNRDVIRQLTHADHITVPSEWVGYAIKRGMWRTPTVLPHGIDVEDFEVRPTRGYILWNKNRPDSICDPEPLNRLALQMPEKDFVTTFGAPGDNVQVINRIPYELMKTVVADAGVYLCTTRETFGVGTLEAMACGVPVVGWNWGGQREIIEHGVTGWLCDPYDYEGLEEGVEWALKGRERIGKAAMEVVRNRFTWRTAVERYADLYRQLYRDKVESHQGPAVSVVIPCYNLDRYLPDAVRSVKKQTFNDWEIVIVDDHSPDETERVANDLAQSDVRIRVVRNESNLYLAGALNRGIREARGRYILPLDADNMIGPETLATFATALDSDRGVDIAYGAAKFVFVDGVTPDTSVSRDGMSGWPQDFSFQQQISHRNQIPSTCMYRRAVWETTGGYRERCKTAEDADFWTRATSFGFKPRKVTNKVTLIYRQRPDSMSRVEADWGWHEWFPWSRHVASVPFGVPMAPKNRINEGIAWNVPSYEPSGVTVVIPVGEGHEKLLIDALDSVQAQSYQAWECIVYNDTGHPLTVPHPWAKVLNSEASISPQGPAFARNRCIEVSTAPVFVPLDADDYFQPNALIEMLAVYQQHGGVAYGKWYDDKGDETFIYDALPEYDARLLTKNGCIHAITAMYPKSAWERLGGFDEDLSHWEDWEFQIGLASIGVCGTKIDKPLFTYRKTTGFRRESNVSSFNEGKAAMNKRWSRIWDGGEELMACRICPGGGGARSTSTPVVPRAQGQTIASPSSSRDRGFRLFQYKGSSTSTRTFVGQSTRKKYRFANNESSRLKYVHEADAPGLLMLRDGTTPMFAEVEQPPSEPTLEPEETAPRLTAERTPTLESEQRPEPDRFDELSVTALSIKGLSAALGQLEGWELNLVLNAERAGDNRKGAIDAIERAQRALSVTA